MVFANTALQLVSIKEGKKVDKIIRPVPDASFDARERYRHVEEIENCTRILDKRKNRELARESLKEQTTKVEATQQYLKQWSTQPALQRFYKNWWRRVCRKMCFSSCKRFRKGRGVLLVRCKVRRQKEKCGSG